MELEDYIINTILKNITKEDKNGNKYINEEDFGALQLSQNERKFVLSIMKKNNITIKLETVTKKDRSSNVEDYEYGIHLGLETRNRDIPVKSKVEFNDLEFAENHDELERFLENEFIPEKILLKKKKNPETGEYELYPSIRLSDITALKYSEIEVKHIMDYLAKENIHVCGYDETLDREFENYDYYRTYKSSIQPQALTKEENFQKFALLSATNDPVIREQLIIGNLRLISYVAWKIARFYEVDFYELQQYGAEALIECVDKFDVTRGYAFSTYAYAYIRGKLLNSILEMKNLKNKNFAFPYMRIKREVEKLHGSTVYDDPALAEEIVDKLIEDNIVSPKSREKTIKRIQLINANSSNYEDREENDLISYDTTVVETEYRNEKEILNKALSMLDEIEENILRDRYGIDDGEEKTIEFCAKKYNLSKDRVRQIEAKAIRKLRHPLKARQLKEFAYSDTDYMDFRENPMDIHKEENDPKHI